MQHDNRRLDKEPASVVGAWRRFGPYGPIYQVLEVAEAVEGDDLRMRVRVLESGEELDYRLREILNDPPAE